MKVKNLNGHLQHIINGYKQQYQFYKQMLDYAEKMENLVTTGVIGIGESLEEREKIIQAIIDTDKQIIMHKEAIMELLHLKEFSLDKAEGLIYPHNRAELEEQSALLRQIISNIIEKDNKIEQLILKLKNDMNSEIKGIKQHFMFQKAYLDRPDDFPEPRIFDHKK